MHPLGAHCCIGASSICTGVTLVARVQGKELCDVRLAAE
jgi:hypothetical protein